jgi:hypothetical protein
MSKAGTMAPSMLWAFAIGAGAVGEVIGHYTPGVLGWFLGVAIFAAGGWAAVHMTQATAGKGILGMLVGALVAAVVSFILWKMAVSSTLNSGQFEEGLKQAQMNGQPLTPEQQATMEKAGSIMKSAGGAIVGATAAFFTLFTAFISGMIGCFIGGATKKSATAGGSGAAQNAA